MRPQKQGCQIFLGTTYQSRKKCTKWPQIIPNDNKIYQRTTKFINVYKNTKSHKYTFVGIPTLSISRPSKNFEIGIFGMQIYHLATLRRNPLLFGLLRAVVS
jgi:hypothetical protein